MGKPKLFIGSSAEQLSVAYAVQENLESDVEVTVWTQGVFELSRSTLESLVDVLGDTDFALFVFVSDDVTRMRKSAQNTVRDNVVFELGLFIGRLGRERNFILMPRDQDLHLPTDLLGMTPVIYDGNRQDGNVLAALGPACNRVRKAISKFGSIVRGATYGTPETPHGTEPLDEKDILSIIESWMGANIGGQYSRDTLLRR